MGDIVGPRLWVGNENILKDIYKPCYIKRVHSIPECGNTIKSQAIFFLDVGCWQGFIDGKAMTTFGLVSGHDVVLCSWLKLHDEEQSGKLIWQLEYLHSKKFTGSVHLKPLEVFASK